MTLFELFSIVLMGIIVLIGIGVILGFILVCVIIINYQLFQMATPGEKGSQKAGAEWGNVSIIFHLRQKRSLSR